MTISSADVAQAVILDSAGATIEDIAGGSLTVGGTLGIDTGTYDLLGGTLTGAHIRIQHGGLLEGSGTIGATVTNNSDIAVSSGTLDFETTVNSSPSKKGLTRFLAVLSWSSTRKFSAARISTLPLTEASLVSPIPKSFSATFTVSERAT